VAEEEPVVAAEEATPVAEEEPVVAAEEAPPAEEPAIEEPDTVKEKEAEES
jgi:hypothetical protein